MKTKLDMLLDLKKANSFDEIRDTWVALGSMRATSKTKVYTKDTLFQVNIAPYGVAEAQPIMTNALVFVTADYHVSPDFPAINWDNATVSEVEGKCCVVSGVTSPHFRVILTGPEFDKITSPMNEDYEPFQSMGFESESSIKIEEDELKIILTECGVPFLRVEELEYTRSAICNYFIKPALQEYFKWFPIVKEVDLGVYGSGQQFKIELPPYCYRVTKLFYNQGGMSGNGYGAGAMSYFRSEVAQQGGSGGFGGGFGGGMTYRKNVPGYTGLENRNAAMLERAANQAMANYVKREKFTVVKEGGKTYIMGYSTLGGRLEGHLAHWSNDWNDVEFDRLNEARNLATAKILQGLGMLRGLVKTDLPGNIDWSLYTNRAEKLESDVIGFWKTVPTSLAVISRG